METVSGFVNRIIFENTDNGFKIVELETKDGDTICTGFFVSIYVGEYIEVTGEWINHPTYGPQIKMSDFKVKVPEDEESILRYLSSGIIKGIGPVVARKITEKFGCESLKIIEENPGKLAQIKGISMNMAQEFGKQVREKKDARNAMMYLLQYGISMNLAKKVYEAYGIQIYGIMEQNPYRLAQDIDGIGFKMADEIARRAGIKADSEYRISSGIVYVLQQEAGVGNTCVPAERVKQEAVELLQINPDTDFDVLLTNLVMENRLVIKNTPECKLVYLPYFYHSELAVATMLHDLNYEYTIDEKLVFKRIEDIEKSQGIELDDIQKQAVLEAVRSGVAVITGGPGTGKTTVINTIIKFFEKDNCEIRLAAPTGRAAKRMSETTHYEAKTIHRLLEVSAGLGENEFSRDKDNPIEADCIVVDEMSMVDISLMRSLLNAIAPGTRLILVGDVDQLPSVGPGNVLGDIIASECFNVVKLTRIYRQSDDSDIVVNAHRINEGKPIDLKKRSNDFLMVEREPAYIFGAMTTLIKDKLSRYVGVNPLEVQVLTTSRVGQFGSVKLNEMLQNELNPASGTKKEKLCGDYVFREGDKVMQIKNNYQLEWEVMRTGRNFVVESGMGVFNGDVGVIDRINTFSDEVVVAFEHEGDKKKYVTYSSEVIGELELAYAITVHKSQGSEYPAIIIPMASGPRRLMNRNLLYTAVTRAKNCVCMVGQSQVFDEMVANGSKQERFSTLKVRIRELTAKST